MSNSAMFNYRTASGERHVDHFGLILCFTYASETC